METGGKHTIATDFLSKDSSLDSSLLKDCHALLHLHQTGINLWVLNAERSSILAAASFHWHSSANSMEEGLESIWQKIDLAIEECFSVQWIISAVKNTLLPIKLYNKADESFILKQSHKVDNHLESVISDYWEKEGVMLLYALPKNLKNWIQHKFPEATIIHNASALRNLTYLFPKEGTFAFLQIHSATQAEFFISTNKKPIFYNFFNYKEMQDLVYYILFALEQNRILPPELNLYVNQKASKALQELLENYIGSVKQAFIPQKIEISKDINRDNLHHMIHIAGGL